MSEPVSRVMNPAWLTRSLVALGIVLRTLQYASNPTLWQDEALLALSIVGRSFSSLLTTPLISEQVAPPLYLALAKISTLVFGPTELAIRLPSFLLSLAAVILFPVLAARVLDRKGTVFAVALFAIAPLIVAHSGEGKQYSGDGLAAVVIMLLAIRLHDSRYAQKPAVQLVIASFVAVLLSHASVMILAGIAAIVALFALRTDERRERNTALSTVAALTFICGLAALWSQRLITPAGGELLARHWADGFMPLPPASIAELFWFPQAILALLTNNLGVRSWGGVSLVLTLLGAWAIWKKRPGYAAILFVPIFVAAILSALHMYPLRGRLALFLLPALALAVGGGGAWIADRFAKRGWTTLVLVMILFIEPRRETLLGGLPAWRVNELNDARNYVSANRQSGDAVFDAGSSAQATLDSVGGSSRLWVILSHDVRKNERRNLLRRLDSAGTRVESAGYPVRNPECMDAVVLLYDPAAPAMTASIDQLDRVACWNAIAEAFPLK